MNMGFDEAPMACELFDNWSTYWML